MSDEHRLALVSVPVLSKITTSSSRARSSASRSFTSSPLRAPSEVEIAMTSGMARPSAWGQAMTSTVAVRTSATSGSPRSHQATSVMTPATESDVEEERGGPIGQVLRREPDACAAATRRMIPDSAVSSPIAVTRTRSEPPAATVPPTTGRPGASRPAATRR